MYTLETKQKVRKPLDELTQQEIQDGIHFIEIKKKQKKKQIRDAKLELLDLESELDRIQVMMMHKKDYIKSEISNIATLDEIKDALKKRIAPKLQFIEYVFNKVEQEQTVD